MEEKEESKYKFYAETDLNLPKEFNEIFVGDRLSRACIDYTIYSSELLEILFNKSKYNIEEFYNILHEYISCSSVVTSRYIINNDKDKFISRIIHDWLILYLYKNDISRKQTPNITSEYEKHLEILSYEELNNIYDDIRKQLISIDRHENSKEEQFDFFVKFSQEKKERPKIKRRKIK